MQFNIRSFDIYRKVPKDLTQPTTTGAVISICSILFITFLVISEGLSFLSTEYVSKMYVSDPTSSDERIVVRLGVTLPDMECKYLGIDIQDDMGRHEVGYVDDVTKTPIVGSGNKVTGCNFRASFRINKVPGNFHVATHSAKERPTNPSMLHTVDYLTFGDDIPENLRSTIPGSFNPLSNLSRMDAKAMETHDFFLKVVPTSITRINSSPITTYQYTYAYRKFLSKAHGGQVMPALWFRYDLTPITVDYTETRKPFYHFLTMFCAIIGGTFTVASIIDSMIFTSYNWFKKAEIGKLT